MTWHLTFLVLDVACCVALAMLLRGGPDWMQRSAIAWLFGGFFMLGIGRVFALAGEPWTADQLITLGRAICHIGVIVYVLRLFVAEQARRCLPKSSKPFRSSPV